MKSTRDDVPTTSQGCFDGRHPRHGEPRRRIAPHAGGGTATDTAMCWRRYETARHSTGRLAKRVRPRSDTATNSGRRTDDRHGHALSCMRGKLDSTRDGLPRTSQGCVGGSRNKASHDAMHPPVAGGELTTDKTMRSYTCEAWLPVESTRVDALTTGPGLPLPDRARRQAKTPRSYRGPTTPGERL